MSKFLRLAIWLLLTALVVWAAVIGYWRMAGIRPDVRDLVLMGAYRAGADPTIDRAIALQPQIARFLSQDPGEKVPLAQAGEQLAELIGNDP